MSDPDANKSIISAGVFIGIDPGLDGALAVVYGGTVTEIHDVPTFKAPRKGRAYAPRRMAAIVQWPWATLGGVRLVAIEDVAGIPPQGSRASIGKQFRGIGIWEGIAAGSGHPYELVRPQRWKREIGLPKGAAKDQSRALAAQLFPDVADQLTRKRDDGRAEAILIAEWARRTYGGKHDG